VHSQTDSPFHRLKPYPKPSVSSPSWRSLSSAFILRHPFFSNPKIQETRHLTPKSQIPFRISVENGSAVPLSTHQPHLPALKISAELPSERLLPQFPLIKKDLALAFQLPSQVLYKNFPYGKIIKTPFSTQPLEMLSGFPVPIPGIVVLTAGPIFPATSDSDLLKIVR
jgi:hypothetical protein